MKILEGQNVDLIAPFPLTQVNRAVGWMHCYRTIIASDDDPHTKDELAEALTKLFQVPHVQTWGLIDKHHLLNIKHDAPLVGFVSFEKNSTRNGFLQIATTRKAFGSGLADEAALMVIDELFKTDQDLLRISAFIMNNNGPAKSLVRRCGMEFEGVLHDYVLVGGQPRDLVHFGITRRTWAERSLPHLDLESVV